MNSELVSHESFAEAEGIVVVFGGLMLVVCVAVDDLQVSCYRILNSLYALGTGKNIYVERYHTLCL